MNAKQEILSRIRSAQKQAGLPDHVDAPRDYHHEGTLNADELREEIAITIVHEAGHHVGIDEERLHELGWG